MYYSDEIIEEVRSKNDIVDVISGYVKLKKQGSSYFGLCPFHSEKSPSFSVSRDKQMYYCFGCGAGGNVFTFIMEYENYSFVEALKFLAQRAGVELPQEEYSKEAKERADTRSALLEMNKLAAKYYYAQLKTEGGRQAREYLQNRQLSQETITAFGLGYSSKYSDDLFRYLKMKGYSEEMIIKAGLVNVDEKHGVYDKFWNRVMFPIMDVNNRVIGFGGRVMGDGKPKYLNSPETVVFDKSRNLYGLNFARTSRKGNVILCILCVSALFLLYRQIMMLSLHDDEGRMLGVHTQHLRLLILLIATLATSGIISMTGLISFISLLAPHGARLIIKNNRLSTMFLSGIIGGCLLTLGDILARSVASTELPVSIFTSLVGAPFLIYLCVRRNRES